jgi:copper homeostasis protein (lipoprotein)
VRLAALLVGLVVAACSLPPSTTAATPGRQMSPLGGLPASFDGEIPGAGGAVRWQLDILPGGSYQRRLSFLNRPAPNAFDDIGRYTLEGRRLTLLGGREGPDRFDLQDDGSLRKLDGAGRPIASALPDRLRRLATAAPIEPRLRLTGLFTHFADAPRIVLCADGRSLPVAMAGDYVALERAYAAARPAPGAPVWVQVEALIALRPAMEAGQPPLPTLVVERHGRVDPQGRCEGPAADRPLLGTDWRVAGSRAALRFDAGRVVGSDGCNRLLGPVTVEGKALRFGPLAGTKMACLQGQAESDAFVAALGRVVRHAIRGDVLELLDAQGATLARLQAAP